jgi:transposase
LGDSLTTLYFFSVNVIDVPLSDEAWQRVSHLLPRDSKQRFGRQARDPRNLLNAILWVITHNEKWARLPSEYQPSQTCYIKWLQWRRDGVMSKIFHALEIEES